MEWEKFHEPKFSRSLSLCFPSVRRGFFDELPFSCAQLQSGGIGVSVIDFFHFFDRIEKADDERGAKRVARFDRTAANLLNQTDIAPLMTPRLVNYRRIERHTRQPRTVCARLRIAQVIG